MSAPAAEAVVGNEVRGHEAPDAPAASPTPQPEEVAGPPRAASAAFDDETEDDQDKLTLEGDLYTYAFISALEPPHPSRKGGAIKGCDVIGPVIAMLTVSLVQILMGYAVFLHVENDLIHTHTRPLHTAYEMFIGSNITVPLHTVEALCGSWEDQEMKDFARGPLRTMQMPDGTVYSPDKRYSLFYNLKMPTRTWDYGRLGSDRSVLDDVMFVISEGVSLNPFTPSGYSLLFVTTLAMFFFSIFSEFRNISKFTGMLNNLCLVPTNVTRKILVKSIWSWDKESDTPYSIIGQTTKARFVGYLTVLSRVAVAAYLLWLGTIFLLFTTLKIDLILNGLALVFLLELDKIVYLGSVMSSTQKFIEEIAPVSYSHKDLHKETKEASHWGPVIMFPLIFIGAMLARWWQVHTFQRYFRMTAAICLFAGPTQPFARKDIIQPVAGFCDSLLGVSCSPSVEPPAALREHGYCIVTDQTTMSRPSVQFYLDDPKLFANRYNQDGTEKSWVQWGEADDRLYQSRRWMKGPYQDLMRKQCLQMYQKQIPPDDVMVDDDSGETMDGAPFLCAREPLFEAVFGDVVKRVDNTNVLGPIPPPDDHEGGLTHEVMEKVRDLRDPRVVKAIDACKYSKVELPTPASPEEEKSPPPAPARASEDEDGHAAFHLMKERLRMRRHHKNKRLRRHLAVVGGS